MPRGRPMRPGRSIRDIDHMIHTDGTYSNVPTVETQPTSPKPRVERPLAGTVFKTKKGSQFMAVHLLGWGVYVYGYPHSYQPRVDDCDFWDWEKYEEEMG